MACVPVSASPTAAIAPRGTTGKPVPGRHLVCSSLSCWTNIQVKKQLIFM
jgi:hypothetical protein